MSDLNHNNKTLTNKKIDAHAHLEDWLEVATKKLTASAEKRVRDEIRGHIATIMTRDDLDESAAVAMLGSPSKANRRYKRRYLTESDHRQYMFESNPPRWIRGMILIVCIFFPATLPVAIWEGKSILPSMFYVAAAIGFAANLVYVQGLRYRVKNPRTTTTDTINKSKNRELWKFIVFGIAAKTSAMLLMVSGSLHVRQVPASINAYVFIVTFTLIIALLIAHNARKILRNQHDILAIIQHSRENDPQ